MSTQSGAEPVKRGRKRDHSRDAVILDATLDTLAEHGWDGLTMDLVAARAKAGKATLYRRWPSKTDLVIEAISRLGAGSAVESPPDTGSLTGDLVALLKPSDAGERHMKIMMALASLMLHHAEFADQIDQALHEPWAQANRIAIERAIGRGDFPEGADVATLSRIIPSMVTHRILFQHRGLDREHLETLIEGVLIPALRSGR